MEKKEKNLVPYQGEKGSEELRVEQVFIETFDVVDDKELQQPYRSEFKMEPVDWKKIKLPKRIARIVNKAEEIKKIAIYGAAGYTDLLKTFNAAQLRYMLDPYDIATRLEFSDSAHVDPMLSVCFEKRNSSIFEDGYTLELELKSQYDENGQKLAPAKETPQPQTKIPIPVPGQAIVKTPQEQPEDPAKTLLDSYNVKYGAQLQMLRDWDLKDNIKTRDKMRSIHLAGMVQGRGMLLIQPPITQLAPMQLPDALKLLNYQFIGAPIIEYVDTWSLVGVRILLQSKEIALRDEMVYYTSKNWGLRKESDFYGTSLMEALLVPSRSYRRLINHDIPKGAVSAYLTKIILQLATRGTPAEQQLQATTMGNNLLAKANDIVVTNLESKVTPVSPQVNDVFIFKAIEALENILISGVGVTKTMIGREYNLNRDIATIQSILYVKYVRKPDEMNLAETFENQLYNPLFAHLCGVESPDDLPVRVVIKRVDKPNIDSAEQSTDVQAASNDQNMNDSLAAENQFAQDKEKQLVSQDTAKPVQPLPGIKGAKGRKKPREIPVELLERMVKVAEKENDYSDIV